jgi:hypothetical protein
MVENPYFRIAVAVLASLLVIELITRKRAPRLTAAQLWALAAGANFARARGDSLETLAIALPQEKLREMLLEGWWIKGPQDVEPMLGWLDREGHTNQLRGMLNALAAVPPHQLEAWLGKYDKDVQQALLFAKEHREEFKNGEIVAWDLVRLIYVARASFSAGYLDDAKAWHHIQHAAQRLQRTYSSWSEMSENYLLGRRYWGEGGAQQKYFDAAASWLLTDKKSPWRRLDWGMPLDQTA